MKKESVLTKDYIGSENASAMFEARTAVRPMKQRGISDEKLATLLAEIQQKLTEGLSRAAEKIITVTLANISHTPENRAKLTQLLSYTFETQGRYKESLEVIEEYDDEKLLSEIELETQISVVTQLAISFNNTNDYPKAVALLNYALEEAKAGNLNQLFGAIYVAFSRVYRKLNEFPISRDHAEKALNNYRENGDWRGMAESYQGIATAYHQEGNSEKSLEFFLLAIQIIGERNAPFLLGKVYSDMSGAYWFLRRPQDGIACLEKSIKFFEQTEHKVQATAAYNNLGLHLTMRGEWTKAENAYGRALELATEANHVHVAGILDSLGELKILRGELAEAQDLLERSVALAEERKKECYVIQSLRNLARCFLLQGNFPKQKKKREQQLIFARKSVNAKSQIWRALFWLRFISKKINKPNANVNLPRLKQPTRHQISSCWEISSGFAGCLF